MEILQTLPFSTESTLLYSLFLLIGFMASGRIDSKPKSKMGSKIARQTEEAFARRSFFYVGGHYEDATKDQTGFGAGKVMKGQMYVESLEPVQVKQKWPIVMISGAGQSGTNFLNTPDGRPGWASYFLHQGYHVYITDQVARGRSAWLPSLDTSQNQILISAEAYSERWTACQEYKPWEGAEKYTQWPGTTGKPGDPVFDQFYASQVPFTMSFKYLEEAIQKAGLALLERIGPAIILTHSQSALYAWGIAEVAQPRGLVKGIIALEPNGPPFVDEYHHPAFENDKPYGLTNIPLTFDPPIFSPSDLKTVTVPPPNGSNLRPCITQDPDQPGGPRKLTHLYGVPTLIVTADASYHQLYDYSTVRFLTDAGVDVTWFNLGEMGIQGNGHFLFLEKNSDEIAEQVGDWLAKRVSI